MDDILKRATIYKKLPAAKSCFITYKHGKYEATASNGIWVISSLFLPLLWSQLKKRQYFDKKKWPEGILSVKL